VSEPWQHHKEAAESLGARAQESRQPTKRQQSPRLAGWPAAVWQAGNSAVNRLLERGGPGQSLEPRTRSWLERLFTANLQHVRVHDDVEARSAAAALDAAAVTRGEDIYLGTEATGDLLAHEVSHVLQQRNASSIDVDRVGAPGDSFEFERGAQQASTGHGASVAGAAGVPGVQRQPASQRATRDEARTALTAFLNRALAAQGGRSLRVTQQVKDAVMHLVRSEPMASVSVEGWLNGIALPGDPAEFAAQATRRMPASIDRKLVDDLSRLPAGPEAPGTLGRVKDVVEKSAPGEPEKPEEPKQPTSQERFENMVDDIRKAQGKPSPTTYGPYSVDVLRLGRIAQGLPGALRKPTTPRAPAPQGRSYPEVDKAIAQIPVDALVPAAARGKPEADNYADARDVAQQQNQSAVDVRLGPNYASVDRDALDKALGDIVRAVRDALPHHATNVRQVNVFFGDRLARWIPVSSAPR